MTVPRRRLRVCVCAASTEQLCADVSRRLTGLGYPVAQPDVDTPDANTGETLVVVPFTAEETGNHKADEARLLVCHQGEERRAASSAEHFDDLLVWPAHDRETRFRVDRLFQPAGDAPAAMQRPAALPPWISGESPQFIETMLRAEKLAAYDLAVMIVGETGAGKEVFARAIHYLGKRAEQPFIAINCGALADSLFENEMFGHVKGAYTDATGDAAGLVAAANGGTLFLDEIDALSPHGQAALLRFLQDGSYRAVGSGETRTADVRVLAATNADLPRAMNEGRFRKDLFYRLASAQLEIPPLRERAQDILLLADHFLADCKRRLGDGERNPHISAELAGWLMAQKWPGNARELRSMIENLFVFGEGDALLPPGSGQPCEREAPRSFVERRQCARDAFEREELVRLMRRCNGNITSAARAALAERKYFTRLLQKHHIDRTEFLL